MKMYGIPNCDTVRKAQKFLDNEKISYQFHDFKKQGLSLATIQNWLESQPIEVLVNKRSTSWKLLTEEQKEKLMSKEDLTVLTEMPTLIKRPVLETNSGILVGFKAEEYQKLNG
ncbi:arsenate reductase [Thiomicrorhabdus immobilis]|uniref:Arsenate reductase n=1 Tax=Thiomicrorhabdus immobilis TaxID=2791037 RepID=A0ABM7MDH9_9GAMM|nr:arsenate reductase [Thiomicrorhabdus immobilis]BCN93448.1 arsenate reductase [Thiomicrorhabdus immobilis]